MSGSDKDQVRAVDREKSRRLQLRTNTEQLHHLASMGVHGPITSPACRPKIGVASILSLCQDPAALRAEGNALFKAGDMQAAVCCYTKALKLSDNQAESAVLYRNRSACYLKLEDHSKAESDATKGRM